MRWLRRLRCHHSLWCCQYVDHPLCNSPEDQHRLARAKWWRDQRKADAR